MKRIAIIGAGAAGCFCAVELKRRFPDREVCVYEASARPMMKLAVTGGGRCNLTNSFRDVHKLSDVYPRGDKLMKRAFRYFSNEDLMAWFEREGVRLVVQDDQCVFPVSQDAMQIVRTLERLMRGSGVRLHCGKRVGSLQPVGDAWELRFADGSREVFDAVALTAGGTSRKILQTMLPEDIELTQTLPSLFTFKIADESLRSLMGAVIKDASLSIAGTAFRSRGALLLTDWGVSGPATLRLSSYAARHLAEHQYRSTLIVNWLSLSEEEIRTLLRQIAADNPKKQLSSIAPKGLTERVWKHLLHRSGIREDLRWAEAGAKSLNRLVSTLTADSYEIVGRAAFKEEFVTCGGVALSDINLQTLECRKHPGLYFAGEVLDVDAVTGGFNLQAAWSMAKVVADSIL